jgi:hypothetical protein
MDGQSFRDEEVNLEEVRCLPNGEEVTLKGTSHLLIDHKVMKRIASRLFARCIAFARLESSQISYSRASIQSL